MLVEALLKQLGRDLDLSVERDIATLRRRCEHEGLSFLTITLPALSDSLERGLEDGLLTVPSSFSRTGSLPRFLGGFFSRVFARTGEPLQDIDADSVFAIRQICRFFKKLKMSCSPERELKAIDHFLEVERELGQLTPSLGRKDEILDKVSGVIWSQVFPEIDPLEIVCQHGPGVTADRLGVNERHQIRYWYSRAEHTFPSDLHAWPNYGYACLAAGMGVSEVSEHIDFLDIRDEPGVRVVFVPKTQQTPRVIAIEPSSMQYMQQGLMHYIVPRLESHRLTRNSVRFTDQSVNQRLAHSSSVDRKLATLDLKDASDRVHFLLVQRIFRSSGILQYLEDARSLHATLPNGINVILNKYASMGSALCFPVEAMVFYTLIQSSMHSQDGRCPSSSSIEQYSALIDIYGDDIIVPVEYADTVVHNLEAYGLKVNINKSFRRSLFRESCGGDYYNGTPVKPVYARQLPPDDARTWMPEHVMAWVSTANQFYELGMWQITQVIREMVEGVLRAPVPRSSVNRGDGVYFTSTHLTTGLRYNSSICGYEQRRIVYQPTQKKDDIDGKATPCLHLWARASGQTSKFRASGSNGFIRQEIYVEPDAQCGPRDRPFSRSVRDVVPYVQGLYPHAEGIRFELRGDLPCSVRKTLLTTSKISTGPWQMPRSKTGLDSSVMVDLAGGSLRPGSLWSSNSVFLPPIDSTMSFASLIGGESITVFDRSLLDFSSSVKRGGFKSKRRWITLIT